MPELDIWMVLELFGPCLGRAEEQRVGQGQDGIAPGIFIGLNPFGISIGIDGLKEDLEVGRGVIDIPKLLKTLVEIKYSGVVSFEYEKDAEDTAISTLLEPIAGSGDGAVGVRAVFFGQFALGQAGQLAR